MTRFFMLRKAKGLLPSDGDRLLGDESELPPAASDAVAAHAKAEQRRTARIVFVAASVDSMDAQLLPSVFQALEAAVNEFKQTDEYQALLDEYSLEAA